MKRIPYSRQSINESDIDAVSEVLRSDWLTQGPTVSKFERAIASYCGAQHAIAFSSASAALHAGCSGLGLDTNDWFATSNITFAASASSGLHCGAQVQFCDVDSKNGLLDLSALEHMCEQYGSPKLVIPVHLAGNCPNLKALKGLSKKFGFSILEDASHALGARYDNKPVGNCAYSDAAVFSLHPVKMITSGEGGILLTNNEALAASAKRFREHGIVRDPSQWKNKPDTAGDWYYEVQSLGFNYRLTDIQAALGLSQLKRLDTFVSRRREIHEHYRSRLALDFWELVGDSEHCISSWHLCVAQLPESVDEHTYRSVFQALRQQGLYVNQHYIPLNRHPLYEKTSESYPGSDSWARRALSVPCHPELTDEDLEYSIRTLNACAKEFCTAL